MSDINGQVHILIVPNYIASDASDCSVINIHVKHRENKIKIILIQLYPIIQQSILKIATNNLWTRKKINTNFQLSNLSFFDVKRLK
jgi:hypothetical protein